MPRDPKTGKRTRPSRPREVVREELLADPNTRKIAASLKLELNKYVELVLDYAYNPDKQVVLNVASDEELRAQGYEPPSPEKVGAWIKAAARKVADKITGGRAARSEFKEPGAARPVLEVPASPTANDTAQTPGKVDEKLLKELKKQRGPKA